MGVVASFQLRRADKRMAKTLVFVKCAFHGDVARLQEMLTKDKVSPNAQDRFGMTALHWAAYGGKLACVQELIKAGASVAVADANGRNALHHACRKDRDDVVKYLVADVHMDVNGLSESKDTPLHKAVIGKSIRCIEVLLQLGANPYLKNDQNRTPLEELDTDPSVVKDVLPEPIPTARMQEELDTWRRQFLTEVESATSGRRRGSLEELTSNVKRLALESYAAASSKDTTKKYAPPTKTSFREVENTLVTSFRARISEFSERSSSAGELSSGSRPSSAHFITKSIWAKSNAVLAANSASSSGSHSTSSAGRLDSMTGKTVVVPLNLQGLEQPATPAAAHQHSDTSRASQDSSTRSDTAPPKKTLKARNLRYAGKRVIMALRVKKVLTGDEKVEVIRLTLQRHMKMLEGGPDSVQMIGNESTVHEEREQSSDSTTRELIRATSGVKLSMPSNA